MTDTMTTLIHKAVSADTATTEKGEFTALAATWSIDRMSERIVKGAFKSLLEAWAGVGRRVPLHWDHKGEAENIIGSIDPATMAETDDGSTSRASSTSKTPLLRVKSGGW